MEKLDHLGWVASQLFDLDGTRLEIRTTSRRFADWIDHTLADYRVGSDGEDDPLLSIVVEDGSSRAGNKCFHLLYRRTSAVVRTLQIGTLARTLLAELDRIGLSLRDDAVHLDGAVVDVRGVPVLVPGFFVPSLAVLGLRAEREGIRLPGHTTVSLDGYGRVVPTIRRLRTAEDALPRLAEIYGSDSSSDRVMIEGTVEPAVILQLAGERDVALRPTTRGLTIHRLATLTMNLPILGGSGLRTLRPLVERARCYETSWAGSLRILGALIAAVEKPPSHPYVIPRTEDTPQGR
jgi:hypothetical protein